jgi:hypothetical protein
MASASIRNITRPRNASMDVIRVGVGALTAGPCVTAGTGDDTVRCITAAFYCRTLTRARKSAAPAQLSFYGVQRLDFLLDPLHFQLPFQQTDLSSLQIELAGLTDREMAVKLLNG